MTTVMKKFSSSHYRVCIKFQLLFYLLADVKSAAAVVIVGIGPPVDAIAPCRCTESIKINLSTILLYCDRINLTDSHTLPHDTRHQSIDVFGLGFQQTDPCSPQNQFLRSTRLRLSRC